MDIYALSRSFWDFSFENPDKIKPNHIAMYFFAIEHCNRLGWKEKFGFPSSMVMDAISIKNWRTYSNTLNELVDFGFIKMIEKSKNQYSSNIIAIVKNTKAQSKALDKALMKHGTKQSKSTVKSIDSIDIPIYNNTNLQNTNIPVKPKSVFTPPTLLEVINYFKEKGYSETAAKKAFDYYDSSNWIDGKGSKVKNWKQKMIGVWFKEENKAVELLPTGEPAIRRRSPGLTMY